MTTIDWESHITAFRTGSQSAAAYCAAAAIKPDTFRYHLYKKKTKRSRRLSKHFQEFGVATELVIARHPNGGLTLSGFDVSHLSQIVGAWSHALS